MYVPNVYFWASLSDQSAPTMAKTRSFSGNNGSGGDTLEVAMDELGKLVLNAEAGRKNWGTAQDGTFGSIWRYH